MRTLLILLFISNTLFSQFGTTRIEKTSNLGVVYDRSNTDYYINYKTRDLKLKFKDIEIQGSFDLWQLRNGGVYLVVNGENDTHMLMSYRLPDSFYGI